MKHQSYIRSLFVAFCAFFVCASAMAGELNPFAFKLSSSLSGDVFTVTYYLNAPATNVEVSIDIDYNGKIDGNDVVYNCNNVKNTQGTTLVKGIYTANISLREKINDVAAFRDKENLRWYVDVKGGNQNNEYHTETITYYTQGPVKGSFAGKATQSYEAKVLNATKVDREYLFVYPSGIDIDVNPQSDNFGMIYCTESRMLTEGSNGNYTLQSEAERLKRFTYWGASGNVKGGTGLYVFDAAFQCMPPAQANYDFVSPKTDNDRTIARGYDMGLSRDLSSAIQMPFTTKYKNSAGVQTPYVRPFGPRKIRLSEDESRLFMSFFTTEGTCLKEGKVARLGYTTTNNSWVSNVITDNSSNLVLDGDDADTYSYSVPDVATESTYKCSYAIETSSGVFAAGPNIGFDVFGSGAGLKLLMLSGTRYCIEPYLREAFRLDEYNLATRDEWNTVSSTYNSTYPNRSLLTCYMNGKKSDKTTSRGYYDNALYVSGDDGEGDAVALAVSYERHNLEYDRDGGFWLSVSRLNTSDMASLIHFNASHNITFTEFWAGRDRAGIRYNHDNDKLLVSGGPYNICWHSTSNKAKLDFGSGTNADSKTVYGHPQAMPGWATIYTVNNTALQTNLTNANVDASWREFRTTSTQNRAKVFTDSVYLKYEDGMLSEDFAWDYADNIYIVGGTEHKVVAYALPHKNKVVSTPCKDNNKMEDTYATQLTVNIYPQNVNCGTVVDDDFKRSFNWYRIGAQYKLRATPKDGYRFVSWNRDNKQYDEVFSMYHTKAAEDEIVSADFGINVHEDTKIVDINSNTDFKAVYVKRELDNVYYSTLCLPFNLTSLTGTPYEGASVLKFVGAETKTEHGDNRIILSFAEVNFANDQIEAGKPYLIKVANPIGAEEEHMFWDVTCPSIGNQGLSVSHGDVTFKGILNPTTFEPSETNLFLVADDRLATLSKRGTINGLRAYFTVPAGVSPSNIQIKVMDKVSTSLAYPMLKDSLQTTKYLWNGQIYIQRGNEVYDLSGARVK